MVLLGAIPHEKVRVIMLPKQADQITGKPILTGDSGASTKFSKP
jgi:hypothetical protein